MDNKPMAGLEETLTAPANKRFRSLIQELFSLVEELYAENDRLTQERTESDELKEKVNALEQVVGKLQHTLIWLASKELEADSMPKLKTEIRRVVAEALKGYEIKGDLTIDFEYTSDSETENE